MTRADLDRHLAECGRVWDIGQLTRADRAHLDRIATRKRAQWPGWNGEIIAGVARYGGIIEKTCWERSRNPAGPKTQPDPKNLSGPQKPSRTTKNQTSRATGGKDTK